MNDYITKKIANIRKENKTEFKIRKKLFEIEIHSWNNEIEDYCNGINSFEKGINELETVWTDTLERVIERLNNANIAVKVEFIKLGEKRK